MSLLLGTDIAERVNDRIRGRVARIGGTVNQLLRYERSRITEVEDINLVDEFFGASSLDDVKTLGRLCRIAYRRLKQEFMWLIVGNRIPRDRKTMLLDAHEAYQNPGLCARYDAIISSNLIEHSANPIFLLLNLHFMTKRGGYQFHAIPHYKYTYDVYRQPTSLMHLIDDFEKMTDISDTTHHEDYIRSAIEKHGWMREFHQKYPVGPPYIHFHVFDEGNTRSLMELMFQDVVNDVLKNDSFSDNVVLFRNELNPAFVERYRTVIEGCFPLLPGGGA